MTWKMFQHNCRINSNAPSLPIQAVLNNFANEKSRGSRFSDSRSGYRKKVKLWESL